MQKPCQGINTWTVPLVRHSGPFLKWNSEKLKRMDQIPKKNKLKTIHEALQPRNNVDRLYASRRLGERRHASIEDSVDAWIQRLRDYMEKCGGMLIAATRNVCDVRTEITRKQKREKKKLYVR